MRATQNIRTTHQTPLPRPKGMRRKDPFYFVVQGRGIFPEDMLRYDQAWAVTGTNIGPDPEHVVQKERSVILASWEKAVPSLQRWSSYGWVVTDKRIPKPNFLP